MAWERRGRLLYYCRKVLRDGHVVTVYLGRGKLAQRAARQDAAKKKERQRLRAMLDELRTDDQPAEKVVAEFEEMVQALVSGYFVSQGYYLHKREWRLKREKIKSRKDQDNPGRKISRRRPARSQKVQGTGEQDRARKPVR